MYGYSRKLDGPHNLIGELLSLVGALYFSFLMYFVLIPDSSDKIGFQNDLNFFNVPPSNC